MPWLYSCNGKEYSSKFKAIKENIATGKAVNFHASKSWTGYDFSIEPKDTWNNLLLHEALTVRDSYRYVKLYYSGGADSDLVLHTFLNNNIFIDEICCFKSGIGSADYEIDNFAFKTLTKIKTLIPNTKITFEEPSVQDYKDYYSNKNWTNEIQEWNYHFRLGYHNDIIKDHNTKSGTINLFGAEPPRLAYRNNHWYTYFLDADIEPEENKYNFFVENPKIHAKQCHMLLSAIREHKNETEYNAMCNSAEHEIFCRDHTGRHDYNKIFPRRVEFWGRYQDNYIELEGDKLHFTAQKEKLALESFMKEYPDIIKKWKNGLYTMYDLDGWINGVPEQGLVGVHTKFYSLENNTVETVDSLYPNGFSIDS